MQSGQTAPVMAAAAALKTPRPRPDASRVFESPTRFASPIGASSPEPTLPRAAFVMFIPRDAARLVPTRAHASSDKNGREAAGTRPRVRSVTFQQNVVAFQDVSNDSDRFGVAVRASEGSGLALPGLRRTLSR